MSINLRQVLPTAVVTAVVSLLVMESYQTTPWLAAKVMRWSVRLRYTDNPERATVRGEELISLLEDLPTLFKLPTAGGFLLRALAYRLAHRRNHARREPRAGQRHLGARFRIALGKAVVVAICTGTVFELEIRLAYSVASASIERDFGVILTFGLGAGVLAAIESVARPPRFYHRIIGGITFALFISVRYGWPFSHEIMSVISSGTAFGVATALTCALVRKFRHAGVAIGILVNIVGIALITLADSLSSSPDWLQFVTGYSGLGFAFGTLAGFATAVERCTRGKISRGVNLMAARDSRMRMIDSVAIPAVSPVSLSGPGAINPEPSIPVGEPHGEGELS
ncbi:MAG: hypothetical protein ACRDRI_02150 [Pseudonocardiaceae bacterium]